MKLPARLHRNRHEPRPASLLLTLVRMGTWAAVLGLLCAKVSAQADVQPQPPADTWKGAVGAGLSLTGGNSDTANYTFSFEAAHDPGSRNVFRFTGLYLRSEQRGVKTSDRLRLGFRDEYTYSERAFVYFDLGYVRDPFKEVDHLFNPQFGAGWKVVKTDRLLLGFDGGAGVVWEDNTYAADVRRSGSVNAGQKLEFQLGEGTRIVQNFAGLWKMENFRDAFYHFSAALTTRLTRRMELKVEFVDDYKNVTPTPAIRKNDTAFLTSVVFNF